jgi:hypothetical protein
MKGLFKRFTLVGPGGMKCVCCAPQSGNKYAACAKRLIKRQAKKVMRRAITKINQGE